MTNHAEINGLSMILGGEIRAVAKLADRGESAVVLLRGPAGSGKTIFAAHLAAHEALVRGGDIVYCCIELLPTELDAQLSGLTFGRERRPLRVSNLPAGAPSPPETTPRIFAPLIEVPEMSEPDLGAELEQAINEAKAARLSPAVVVIDSLAEGYRLGTSMPRALADALAKFAAERGLLLILVEETIDARDSAWTFVADVVLELAHHGASGTAAAEQRAVTVRKNRFGPAHVGPHTFIISRERGVEVYPRLGTYLSESARELLPRDVPGRARVRWEHLSYGHDEIPYPGEVLLVTGSDPILVSIALEIIVSDSPYLRLNMKRTAGSRDKTLYCGDPILSADRMIFDFLFMLRRFQEEISGVVIGDLAAIDRNIDPNGLRRALPVLVMIARAAGLPVAMFETVTAGNPLSVYLADTIFCINSEYSSNSLNIVRGSLTSRLRGQRYSDFALNADMSRVSSALRMTE